MSPFPRFAPDVSLPRFDPNVSLPSSIQMSPFPVRSKCLLPPVPCKCLPPPLCGGGWTRTRGRVGVPVDHRLTFGILIPLRPDYPLPSLLRYDFQPCHDIFPPLRILNSSPAAATPYRSTANCQPIPCPRSP